MSTKIELLAIDSLRKQLEAFKSPPLTLTIDEVFKDWPEGDFHWKDSNPGDPHKWYCDGCHAWHEAYYNWEYRRENGKRKLMRHAGDSDGDWQPDESWEEEEDPTEILTTMQNEIDEYFKGWALYYLSLAESGAGDRADAIKSARENIMYLYMRRKNG